MEVAQKWIDIKGFFKKEIEVIGWLYPGGMKRHDVHKNTMIRESIESALPLLFAPIGVIYYLLNSKSKGRKSRLAMLLPNIFDLESYTRTRRRIAESGVLGMTATSATDAALRMLLEIEINEKGERLINSPDNNFICRAVTFGIVGWNEKQKTRTDTRNVIAGKLSGFENYQIADGIFKNDWQQFKTKIKDENGKNVEKDSVFVTTFSAREIIAENIANNKAWYYDIATFINNREACKQLLYERKELYRMVNEAKFDDETKRLFIDVCYDSWRKRLGKLSKRDDVAKMNKKDRMRKFGQESEKVRTSLMRSKNAEAVRETVIDLWARAGINKKLEHEPLMKLYQLFDEKNWREARDLALLALVSYQPRNAEEAEILDEEETNFNQAEETGEIEE